MLRISSPRGRRPGDVLTRKQVLGLYRKSGWATRLYLRVKLRICPFLEMETFFPREGRIIDLGCGNGVFSNLLKLGAPSREILGFDLDAKKIRAARKVHAGVASLEFREADIAAMDFPPGDVFSIIDVFYLIPRGLQEDILRRCHAALPRGGKLILKDMDTRPAWKYAWNAFQETLAVKIIGFTLGGKFYFRGREDYRELLGRIGFDVETAPLDRGYWYPHILYICRKR